MKESLIKNHYANTLALKDPNKLDINPFTTPYLSYFLTGKVDAEGLAKVMVYPRSLGTSISTSFGSGIQKFIVKNLSADGSMIDGIDFQFDDKVDGRRKYCQLKSGPNVLNFDDVTTIKNHFVQALRRARENHVPIVHSDLVLCIIYGSDAKLNSFIKKVKEDYDVYIGKEFWYRLTGDPDFYDKATTAMLEIAKELDMDGVVENVVKELSSNLKFRK